MSSPLHFGRFEVLRRADGAPDVLAEDPPAMVCKAWDGEQLALVVVKTLSAEAAPELRSRFMEEARAMARLRHLGVIRVISIEEHPDTPYYAMEWCEGPSLMEWVGEHGAIPWGECFRLARQWIEALSALYGGGLVPRHLSPETIVLTKEEETDPWQSKITDYGLPEEPGRHQERGEDAAAQGSPAYKSPERLIDFAPQDMRSDFYSLGAVLWYCLTGKAVFEGSPFDIVLHHLNSEPDYSPLPGNLPASGSALLKRLLAKSREDRPKSVEDLADALDRILASKEGAEVQGGAPDGVSKLGRYELEEEVLRDGLGTLWRARDLDQGRMVALRVVASEIAGKRAVMDRLEQDARLALRYPHASWQNVLEVKLEEHPPRLVLEWVDGPTLLALLKSRQTLPLQDVGPLLLQIAEAVDMAATVGIGAVELAAERLWLHVAGWIGMLHSDHARWLRHPLALWPEWKVRVCPVSLDEMGDAAGRDTPAIKFLRLCFRVLTGHALSAGAYTPSPALSVAGNTFFERYLAKLDLADLSCLSLLRELFEAEGLRWLGAGADQGSVASENVPGQDFAEAILEQTAHTGSTELYRVAARTIAGVRLKELEARRVAMEQQCRALPLRDKIETERDWVAQERERLAKARRALTTAPLVGASMAAQSLVWQESQRRVEDLAVLLEAQRKACRKLEAELELGALSDFQKLRSETPVDLSEVTAEPTLRNTEAAFRWREAAKLGQLDQLRDEVIELEMQLRQAKVALQNWIGEQTRLQQEAKGAESLAREQISAEERCIEEWRKALDAKWIAWQASLTKRRVFLLSCSLGVALLILLVVALLPDASEERGIVRSGAWPAAHAAMIGDHKAGRWMELLHDCATGAKALEAEPPTSGLLEAHQAQVTHESDVAARGLLELGIDTLPPRSLTSLLGDLEKLKGWRLSPAMDLLAAQMRMGEALKLGKGEEALVSYVEAAPLHPDFPGELSPNLAAALKKIEKAVQSGPAPEGLNLLLQKVKPMLGAADGNQRSIAQIEAAIARQKSPP